MQLLSQQVKKSGKSEFKAFLIFIDGDPYKLKKLNKELSTDNIALCTMPSTDEGVKKYDINLKAKSTVLVYTSKKVTAKLVDYDAERDAAELTREIEKVWKK